MSIAKADRYYWDGVYKGHKTAREVFDPHKPGIRNFGRRLRHKYFVEAFRDRATQNRRLLEIGCGGSRMLPYFSREFGFDVSGLDYSVLGCEMAKQILAEEGVQGDILKGDLFDLWPDRTETYDVIVSFGVVEHFEDMVGCIKAMSRLLKPGGLMITLVPNLCGLIGTVQKSLCSTIYSKHFIVDLECLKDAHERSGFSEVLCEYVGFMNFGVVNLNDIPRKGLEWHAKTAVLTVLRGLTAASWLFEEKVHPLPPNRITSPYVICRAVK